MTRGQLEVSTSTSALINFFIFVIVIGSVSFISWFLLISYNLFIEDDPEKHRAFDDDCYQKYVVEWDQAPPYENGEEDYQRCLGENPHYEGYASALPTLCFCCFFGFFILPFFVRA